MGKRLELLREAVPRLSRVAVLSHATNPGNAQYLRQAEVAAQALGLQLQFLAVRDAADFDRAFGETRGASAIVQLDDVIFTSHRRQVVELAVKHQLPAMYGFSEFVHAGGRAPRWICSPLSPGRNPSATWMASGGYWSARAPADSPRSTPPRSVPTGWSRSSRSRPVVGATRTSARPSRVRRIGWPSCSRRSRRASPCPCCGSMPRTTNSSARGCRSSGSRAFARQAAAASSS
jgi:hypothetical protein